MEPTDSSSTATTTTAIVSDSVANNSSSTSSTTLNPLSRPDAAKRIRTASQHPVVSPLIKSAMSIIADAIEGEWVTEDNVRLVAKTGQLLLGYESEYQELKDRLKKTENALAELNTLDDHRAHKDYLEAQAMNQSLLSTTVEQMGKLVEVRTNNLYDENTELHKRIKTLENTLNEVRKENIQLKISLAAYTNTNDTINPNTVNGGSNSSNTNTGSTTTNGTENLGGGPSDGLIRVKPKK
jgi:hypothetical protein